MKVVKEHINEKFEEISDPVADMGIGKIDLEKVYNDTVIAGINKWFIFLKDLDLIGKKVTFDKLPMKTEVTIKIKEIKRGQLPNEIYLYDGRGEKYILDIRGKLIIHK
jgi:hypothetical protein